MDDNIRFYKIVPSILNDLKKKGDEFKYGVMSLDIGIEGERRNIRVIVMPEFTGILNDDDELRYIFENEEDDEEEDNEDKTDHLISCVNNETNSSGE